MPPNKTTRVAAVAMQCAMAEPDRNLDRVVLWAERARAEGATFAVFPEECITGSLNKSKRSLAQVRPAVEHAAAIAEPRLTDVCRRLKMTLAVGTIEPCRDRYRNSVLIVGPSGLLARYGKVHLPNATEKEWFVPGKELIVATSQGWTFSVGICADLNYPEVFRAAARAGAEFFLLAVGCSGNGTPEGAVAGRNEYSGLMRVSAVANGLCIAYADQVGPDRLSLAFSMNWLGDVVDCCCAREGIVMVDVSREAILKARAVGDPTNLRSIRPKVYGKVRICKDVGRGRR
jgi:N-carbamoylputrescine amidase